VTVLTSTDVDGLAAPAEYVDAVREGCRQRCNGAPAPPRTKLTAYDESGMMTGYLALLPETGARGGYIYAGGFGAADAWSVKTLFDAESGRLRAPIDGASMNPFNTGAAGAVGVDAFAREDSATLGVVGTGAQASGQLVATSTVRDFESVRVFSPTREHRMEFAASFDETLDRYPPGSGRGGGRGRRGRRHHGDDVGRTGLRRQRPPAGDARHGDRSVPPGETRTRRNHDRASDVRPRLRERAFQDAGSFVAALESGVVDEDHAHAELGEVVAGVASGWTSPDEITVFDSGGTGIETVAQHSCSTPPPKETSTRRSRSLRRVSR
jgi:alanine dehydrogenase